MNFASAFAYVPEHEDEAAAPMSIAPSAAMRGAAMGSAAPMRSAAADLRRKAAAPGYGMSPAPTTNVIQVDVGAVGEAAPLATGDPTICGLCNAVMSSISKVTRDAPAAAAGAVGGDAGAAAGGAGGGDEEPTYSWTCEFCCAVNTGLRLAPEELPEALAAAATAAGAAAVVAPAGAAGGAGGAAAARIKGVDYLLVPPTASDGEGGGGAGDDASCIVFASDVSGSMCITVPLADAVARKLRGAAERDEELRALRAAGDAGDQFLPGERRGTTYVSRLQALQAAIAMQVETLAKAKPAQRVGLVTFASDVTIYSDGTGEPRVLAGSRLGDYAALRAAGDGATPAKPVKDTAEALVRRIYGLREEGATALGPAVLVAVAMAAGRPGSRVVIVTDGMANTGLGSLEPPDLPAGASPEMKEQAAQSAKAESDAFYGKVRGLAMEAGVTVDVIGFSDANCNLEALSALAEATGGSVTRVEPATITEQFAGVLEEEVLAINASVTMIAHAGLFVRDPAQELAIEAEFERHDIAVAADRAKAASAPKRAALGEGGAADAADDDEAAAVEDGVGRAARIAKVAKERQMKQVVASMSAAPASAAKRAAPAPAAAAGGAGAATAAAADASPAAAPMEVQVNAIAGLLAQKHGLRAGRVIGQSYASASPAPALAAAAAAPAAAAAASPVLSRAAAAPPAPVAEEAEAAAAAGAAADKAAAPADEAASAAAAAPGAAAAAAAAPPAAGGEGGAGDGGGAAAPMVEPRAPEASSYTIYIGNVNKSTEATVEFGQKAAKDLHPGVAAEVARARALPFQLQIAYTRKDGAQLLRVITSSQPVTREASRAQSAIAASPMVSHAARSAAALAKGGRYGACATVNDQYRSFLSAQVRADDEEGASALKAWSVEAEQLNTVLRSEMASEASRAGRPPRSKMASHAASKEAAPRSRWAPMGSVAAAAPSPAADGAPSLLVGGPSPAHAPIRDALEAPPAPGRPGRAQAQAAAGPAAPGASPAVGGGFFASIGRAFGFASASASPAPSASPMPLSLLSADKDAPAPAAAPELLSLSPGAEGGAAGGAGSVSFYAHGIAAESPAAAAYAPAAHEDDPYGSDEGPHGIDDAGDDYDEAEEDDAVGAAGAADRIARRAGNDDLAAQISAMSKGGKKYSSKR